MVEKVSRKMIENDIQPNMKHLIDEFPEYRSPQIIGGAITCLLKLDEIQKYDIQIDEEMLLNHLKVQGIYTKHKKDKVK